MDRFMIPKEPHEGEHFTFAVKGRYYTIQKGKEYVVREKGEWEWKMGIPRCSVCNDPAPGDPYDGEVYTTTFCPSCGADMRKEENNG